MLFFFKDITYTLGADRRRQITVSGSIPSGGTLAVRGPSGAGKSTLLRILAKLQTGCGGEAFLDGESWRQIPPANWRFNVHYLAQKPFLFEGTVADNLAKPFETRMGGGKKFDAGHARAIFEQLHLPRSLWHQDAKTLSAGEAARVALARSLLIDPKIMLLDEPAAALDGKARDGFYALLSGWLSAAERGALLVSHDHDYKYLAGISFVDIEPAGRED